MNPLDLAFVVAVPLAAAGGARMGFARRVLAWAGLAVGLVVASALLPRIMGGSGVGSTGRFVVAAAVLMAGGILGQVVGGLVGGRMHTVLSEHRLGRADSVLGAVVGVVGLVLVSWVLVWTMADVPGWTAREARGSAVWGWMDDTLGRPPAPLDNLRTSLGLDRLPRVFNGLSAAPEVAPPPSSSPVPGAVLAVAERSTLRVSGETCGGNTLFGSGWVVAPGLVVTNAHVVAGTTDTKVETVDGESAPGRVVAFDARRDVAVISAPRLDRAAFELGTAADGSAGDVLGYPGGGQLSVQPFRVDREVQAQGRDIYDRDPASRRIYILASSLAAGDSGGPMIDPSGKVVGMAFAIAPDRAGVAYALTPAEITAVVGTARPGRSVDVGPCIG